MVDLSPGQEIGTDYGVFFDKKRRMCRKEKMFCV